MTVTATRVKKGENMYMYNRPGGPANMRNTVVGGVEFDTVKVIEIAGQKWFACRNGSAPYVWCKAEDEKLMSREEMEVIIKK
jgi:hypothetical protein